jgi:hypothetical protein
MGPKSRKKRAPSQAKTPSPNKKAAPSPKNKGVRRPARTEHDDLSAVSSNALVKKKDAPSSPAVKEIAEDPPVTAETTEGSVATGAPMAAVQVHHTEDGSHASTGHEEMTMAPSTATRSFQGLMVDSRANDVLRHTIRSYVGNHFFPHVKFITKMSKLAYHPIETHPDSYCAIITQGCNLPANLSMDPASWWEIIAKKEVKRKISQLRSDKLTALKWLYYGKC